MTSKHRHSADTLGAVRLITLLQWTYVAKSVWARKATFEKHLKAKKTMLRQENEMSMNMKRVCVNPVFTISVLMISICCSSNIVSAEINEKQTSDQETFHKTVKPFLKNYCTGCHGSKKQEGDVNLSIISHDLASGRDMELWKTVLKQLTLEEMPPTKERQPSESAKNELMSWIHSELSKSGNSSDLSNKLRNPEFGNLVNHQKLFSGEIKTPAFSPARLWRVGPNIFDNIKSSYGGDARQLRQPFIVEDKKGIKEYADLLFADSAVVNVLLMNAGYCADQLIERRQEYKAIVSSKDAPSDADLESAVSQHFKSVVYREPTASELNNYLGLFKKSAPSAGNAEAFRVMLMAIMLHQESVYRIEIGFGTKDSFGRRLLSPTEMAFAISYGLTDRRPDKMLLQAAESGTLKTKDDAASHVKRILEDDSIDKPRILRFFQEFYGYTHAHKVFKDAKRSGGFHYYGENYPNMYERDADFFVLNILEKDKDVFEELMTSNEYYILNRQTFRNTIHDFYERNKEVVDRGDLPEEKTKELLDRLGLKGWHELNKKYFLHGFDRAFKGKSESIKKMAIDVARNQQSRPEKLIGQSMHPLYSKYPMVYDLGDEEQNFLLPQPYKRPNRAGMLTHPAWLIAHSLNDSTDPIRRGKWIRERLLAGVVPDVPITVDASIPEDHHKTLRERLQVTEQVECWRCHQKMNPLGHTFEVFDDFGRYRLEEALDKLPKVAGKHPSKPVNATGELDSTGETDVDGEVNDALELIHRLARSEKVRQSTIRHMFRYYMGRNEMLSDSQTLVAADKAYMESGGSFKALLISLLTSDSFLYRKTMEQRSGDGQ